MINLRMAESFIPVKAIKTEEEMIVMRRAAKMHDELAGLGRHAVRAGITPQDVVDEVRMPLPGHSPGFDLVERPAFSPLGGTLPINHGMVISLHPTTHGAAAWGYPNNMSFHFTSNGMERMLEGPEEISVV